MNYKLNAVLLVIINSLVIAHFAASTLILFLQDNGMSISQILLLQAVGSVVIVFFELPTGIFADVKGKKLSVFLSALMYTLSAILMVTAHSFTMFFIATTLAGLAVVFYSGALDAIIYDSLEYANYGNISKFISYANIVKALSLGVAVIIGGFIASINYRYNFMLMAGLGSVAILFTFFVKEPPFKKPKTSMIKEGENLKKTIMYVLNHDSLLLIMSMSSIIGNLMAITIIYSQPLLRDVGFSLAFFGVIYAMMAIVQAIGGRVGSMLEKHINPRNFAFLVIYGVAFSFAILAMSYSELTFFISVNLLSFFSGMFVPVWFAYQNRFIPSSRRATINSFGSMLNSSIFIFFAPIFGLFTEAFSMRFSLLLASVFSLMIVPILARRIKKRDANY